MFCGKCGKNIGDMTVCPYCNPELQPQEEDSKTTLFSGDAYPQPQEEDSKTTLFSGDAYPQPQEEDNKTTLFSGDAYPQPQEEDNKTTLFSGDAYPQPQEEDNKTTAATHILSRRISLICPERITIRLLHRWISLINSLISSPTTILRSVSRSRHRRRKIRPTAIRQLRPRRIPTI